MLDPIKVVTVAIIAVAVGWLYDDVLVHLVSDWSADPNNSHGFLVPVISLYLVWERWDAVRRVPVRPSWLGAGVMVLGVLALTAGHIGAELFVQRASLILVIIGLVWFNLGFTQIRLLAFPILFLALAIPLPAILLNAISFPLQLFAAKVAEAVLYGLSIPVFREGNIIHLAHTSLEVAEACSGIRSLVSLIALSIIFAYVFQRHWAARLVLAVSAIPIAVLTNAGRVAGTGILAQIFGEQAAQGFYHTFSGWLVFVAAVAVLIAENALIQAIITRNSRHGRLGGGSG